MTDQAQVTTATWTEIAKALEALGPALGYDSPTRGSRARPSATGRGTGISLDVVSPGASLPEALHAAVLETAISIPPSGRHATADELPPPDAKGRQRDCGQILFKGDNGLVRYLAIGTGRHSDIANGVILILSGEAECTIGGVDTTMNGPSVLLMPDGQGARVTSTCERPVRLALIEPIPPSATAEHVYAETGKAA